MTDDNRNEGLGAPEMGSSNESFAWTEPEALPDGASACLDWTEDRPHLSGVLGAELCTTLLERGWILPRPAGRAVRLTDAADGTRA